MGTDLTIKCKHCKKELGNLGRAYMYEAHDRFIEPKDIVIKVLEHLTIKDPEKTLGDRLISILEYAYEEWYEEGNIGLLELLDKNIIKVEE